MCQIVIHEHVEDEYLGGRLEGCNYGTTIQGRMGLNLRTCWQRYDLKHVASNCNMHQDLRCCGDAVNLSRFNT